MSYGQIYFDKDHLVMGSDSAISTNFQGKSYRIHNEGQKIYVVDDMLIFCSGDADLSKFIMDDFMRLKVKNIENLRDTIKYWFNQNYKHRPLAKEKIDNGYIANITLAATYEDESIVLYEMKQENNFEINRIALHNKVGYYSCGVNYKQGNKLFASNLDKLNCIEKAFRITYAQMACEEIGGTLQVYTLSKNGIREVMNERIKENAYRQFPFERTPFENTDSIKKLLTNDAHIEGSDLTLRDGGGVMKMFPRIGLWAGAENFDDAPFSVNMEGRATMRDLVIKGSDGKVMLETRGNKIWFDNMDLEGIGRLLAEMLQVNTILADKAYVNDLTVNKVKTLPKDVNVGDYVDYIEIQDNYIHFNTAKVNDKQQAKDSKDRLLYWQDNEKKVLTTEDTGIIAYAYTFLPADIKSKQIFTFEGSGDLAMIKNYKGIGDGATETSAKLIEHKYNGGYKNTYGQSNTGWERSIDLADNGIFINSEKGATTVTTKDFTVTAKDGGVKIGNNQGCLIEMNGKTMTFKAGDFQFQNI